QRYREVDAFYHQLCPPCAGPHGAAATGCRAPGQSGDMLAGGAGGAARRPGRDRQNRAGYARGPGPWSGCR
ncbi:hypothetical protein, partial [Micromonospora sp. NPDC050200]|uniref:hypothetical protein n=1 Tax=Micromonospora sp. NPDC050200 TaxID=3155664 RepID=UPI0033EAAF6B